MDWRVVNWVQADCWHRQFSLRSTRIEHLVHVAAACPAYSLANDSTYYGLEDDVTREPLPIVRGRIAVPQTPGLGIEVDPEKLGRYCVG